MKLKSNRLSESRKQDYTLLRYSAVRGKVLDCLHYVCGVDWDFQSTQINLRLSASEQ